jgi:hypothetical protein
MHKEVDDHMERGHWKFVKEIQYTEEGYHNLKWQPRTSTHEVYKWKARPPVDGSKQQDDEHYDENYSSVLSPILRTYGIKITLKLHLVKNN